MKAVAGLTSAGCFIDSNCVAAVTLATILYIWNRNITTEFRCRHLVAGSAILGVVLVVREARFG